MIQRDRGRSMFPSWTRCCQVTFIQSNQHVIVGYFGAACPCPRHKLMIRTLFLNSWKDGNLEKLSVLLKVSCLLSYRTRTLNSLCKCLSKDKYQWRVLRFKDCADFVCIVLFVLIKNVKIEDRRRGRRDMKQCIYIYLQVLRYGIKEGAQYLSEQWLTCDAWVPITY